MNNHEQTLLVELSALGADTDALTTLQSMREEAYKEYVRLYRKNYYELNKQKMRDYHREYKRKRRAEAAKQFEQLPEEEKLSIQTQKLITQQEKKLLKQLERLEQLRQSQGLTSSN